MLGTKPVAFTTSTDMTYTDYINHAKAEGFQPLSEAAFEALRAVGFNPITNTWE